MKVSTLKKISLSVLSVSLLSSIQSCDNGLENPGYPDVPSIKLEKIKFIETGSESDYDTLKFTISYKDGDRDLGLSSLDENDFLFPFHYEDYFLEDGTGDTIPIQTALIDNYGIGINSIPQSGTLVTNATREKVNYEYLPAYNPNSCVNYSFSSEFLVRKNLNIIDESFNITDTVTINSVDFVKIAENHFNISVDFYVFRNGSFEKFDWFEEYCIMYDGRFPLIVDKPGGTFKYGKFKINIKTPWEGKITYSMPNSSFLSIFGNSTVKLAITIKDRALNTSNTIFTPEFTLEDIK
jgi:hypothetical protein